MSQINGSARSAFEFCDAIVVIGADADELVEFAFDGVESRGICTLHGIKSYRYAILQLQRYILYLSAHYFFHVAYAAVVEHRACQYDQDGDCDCQNLRVCHPMC